MGTVLRNLGLRSLGIVAWLALGPAAPAVMAQDAQGVGPRAEVPAEPAPKVSSVGHSGPAEARRAAAKGKSAPGAPRAAGERSGAPSDAGAQPPGRKPSDPKPSDTKASGTKPLDPKPGGRSTPSDQAVSILKSTPLSLGEVRSLHRELAGLGGEVFPEASVRAGFGPAAFRAADRDGDGSLSSAEFIVGYHRILTSSTPARRSATADLEAEVTRLRILDRARRTQAKRPESRAPSAPLSKADRGTAPQRSVRVLIPTESARPLAESKQRPLAKQAPIDKREPVRGAGPISRADSTPSAEPTGGSEPIGGAEPGRGAGATGKAQPVARAGQKPSAPKDR